MARARIYETAAEAVADVALGLMIDLMRGITRGDRYIRAGGWEKELAAPGRDLRRKRCGIVGLGRIGQAIAKRLQAKGDRIVPIVRSASHAQAIGAELKQSYFKQAVANCNSAKVKQTDLFAAE